MTSVGIAEGRRPRPVTLVLPVKELLLAKMRLGLPASECGALALRFFRHTLGQAARSPLVGQIIVVTRDSRVAEVADPSGATVVAEPETSDPNRAAELGSVHAERLAPEAGVAVMVSDLPYLDEVDLTTCLLQFVADGDPICVADRTGTGTTTVVQHAHPRLPFRFGPYSASSTGGSGTARPAAHSSAFAPISTPRGSFVCFGDARQPRRPHGWLNRARQPDLAYAALRAPSRTVASGPASDGLNTYYPLGFRSRVRPCSRTSASPH